MATTVYSAPHKVAPSAPNLSWPRTPRCYRVMIVIKLFKNHVCSLIVTTSKVNVVPGITKLHCNCYTQSDLELNVVDVNLIQTI